jgi:hypothetical protein
VEAEEQLRLVAAQATCELPGDGTWRVVAGLVGPKFWRDFGPRLDPVAAGAFNALEKSVPVCSVF